MRWLKLITYFESQILPTKTWKVIFLVWFLQLMKSKKGLIIIKGRTLKKTFSKISLITKCYTCQGYEHVATNYPSPFKIAINDEVFIEAPKPDSTISLKVTHMIKEFIVIHHLSSMALLSTPLSPSFLLPTPTVDIYFDHQPLPFSSFRMQSYLLRWARFQD